MKKVVILENIRSLHNVGSIFRTSDAAGFDTVFLVGYTGAPPDRRIEKVSLGAENFLPWKKFETITEAIKSLPDDCVIISAEQTNNSQSLFSAPKPQSLAIIMGNEVDGVSEEARNQSHHVVEIPMYGQKQSLNVSVAAGILLYYFTDNSF